MRIRDWRIVFIFLILCAAVESSWASCPLLTHPDADNQREFQNVCQQISNLTTVVSSNATTGSIPSGLIAMFSSSCPSGWTRFSTLDNTFPYGGSSYGATGGSATHAHTFTTNSAGAHTHTLTTLGSVGYTSAIGVAIDAANFGTQLIGLTSAGGVTAQKVSDTTDSQGSHVHTGTTDAASSLPPYLTVIWCQKN